MNDDLTRQAVGMLLEDVAAPFVIAGVLMALIVLIFGPKQSSLGSALAIAAGLGFCFWYRDFEPLIPGPHAWNYLPWLALAALGVGRVAKLGAAQPWPLYAAASIAVAWLQIPALARTEIDWLAPVFATVVFVSWSVLDRVAEESDDGSVAGALALVFGVAGIVLLQAGSLKFMERALPIAAALLAIGLVSAWRRVETSGVIPAVAVLLPGLLLTGERNTDKLKWYVFALPALAPLLLVETLPIKHWPRVRLFAVRCLLVAIPLAIALVLAFLQGEPSSLEEDWN